MHLLPLEGIDKPAVVIPFVAEAVAEADLITDLRSRGFKQNVQVHKPKNPKNRRGKSKQ